MTVAELIALIREDYLDDLPSASDPEEDDYRWSTSWLLRSIAEAERQACRRMGLIWDDTTAADNDSVNLCQITLVEDQSTYPISQKVTNIETVLLGSTLLTQRTTDELDRNESGWRTADAATPDSFVIKNRKLILNRDPSSDDADDVIYLGVWRLPLRAPKTTESPAIAEMYHRDLRHWVLYECWSKNDEDTLNMKRAENSLIQFNAIFGEPVAADVMEWRLENPTVSAIRPHSGYSTNSSVDDDDVNWWRRE